MLLDSKKIATSPLCAGANHPRPTRGHLGVARTSSELKHTPAPPHNFLCIFRMAQLAAMSDAFHSLQMSGSDAAALAALAAGANSQETVSFDDLAAEGDEAIRTVKVVSPTRERAELARGLRDDVTRGGELAAFLVYHGLTDQVGGNRNSGCRARPLLQPRPTRTVPALPQHDLLHELVDEYFGDGESSFKFNYMPAYWEGGAFYEGRADQPGVHVDVDVPVFFDVVRCVSRKARKVQGVYGSYIASGAAHGDETVMPLLWVCRKNYHRIENIVYIFDARAARVWLLHGDGTQRVPYFAIVTSSAGEAEALLCKIIAAVTLAWGEGLPSPPPPPARAATPAAAGGGGAAVERAIAIGQRCIINAREKTVWQELTECHFVNEFEEPFWRVVALISSRDEAAAAMAEVDRAMEARGRENRANKTAVKPPPAVKTPPGKEWDWWKGQWVRTGSADNSGILPCRACQLGPGKCQSRNTKGHDGGTQSPDRRPNWPFRDPDAVFHDEVTPGALWFGLHFRELRLVKNSRIKYSSDVRTSFPNI